MCIVAIMYLCMFLFELRYRHKLVEIKFPIIIGFFISVIIVLI